MLYFLVQYNNNGTKFLRKNKNFAQKLAQKDKNFCVLTDSSSQLKKIYFPLHNP
jgi:hypothetical protein